MPGSERASIADQLAQAVREAGDLALTTFNGSLKHWIKGKDSPVSSAAVAVAVNVVPAVAVPGASRPTVGGVVSGPCTTDITALLTARLSDVSIACAENVIADPTGVPAGTR